MSRNLLKPSKKYQENAGTVAEGTPRPGFALPVPVIFFIMFRAW
jgi:hypothetical protein